MDTRINPDLLLPRQEITAHRRPGRSNVGDARLAYGLVMSENVRRDGRPRAAGHLQGDRWFGALVRHGVELLTLEREQRENPFSRALRHTRLVATLRRPVVFACARE